MRHSIFTLLLLGNVMHLDAQPQHRHWLFGFELHLDMGGSEPVSLLESALSTYEGVASISDENGELLFYTNGVDVWGNDHELMPNGTDLAGHLSSSQSALIVPSPGDEGRYYIFTTSAQASANGGIYDGLAWSMVDMDANGGIGDVVLKNQLLVAPVVEKLHAVRHSNGMDVWVIVHGWNNDQFHAYLVTCTGVEGPVTSSAGRPYLDNGDGTRRAAVGCMKVSAQGDRLASVWPHYNADGSSEVRLDVLTFDTGSGVVGSWLGDERIVPINDNIMPYGVAFSPDGSKLYTTENGLQSSMAYGAIFQYDLSGPEPMDTEVQLISTSMYAFGTLQLAPDGRLMVAQMNNNNTMTCISLPDLAGGACDLQVGSIPLFGGFSTWGLPNFWDTYPTIDLDPLSISDTTRCDGAPIILTVDWQHPFHTAQFLWNTGATSASITIAESGIYSVIISTPCTTLFDTVRVTIGNNLLDLGPDLRLCEGDTAVLYADAAMTLEWSDGSFGDSLVVNTGGTYWAFRIDQAGCLARDSVEVEYRNCLCPFFLPNAFTPNDDGINDSWGPIYDCELEHYQLRLYDRWGKEIISTEDPLWTWNGELAGQAVPNTVLAYTLHYSWHDGERQRTREDRGHLIVIE